MDTNVAAVAGKEFLAQDASLGNHAQQTNVFVTSPFKAKKFVLLGKLSIFASVHDGLREFNVLLTGHITTSDVVFNGRLA